MQTKKLELEIWAEDTQIKMHWEGRSYRFYKTRGMGYLVELLEHPYRQITAMELANMEIVPEVQYQYITEPALGRAFGLCVDTGNRYSKADGKTVREIKHRLVQLTELQAELQTWCDWARLEEVQSEREALIEYLC